MFLLLERSGGKEILPDQEWEITDFFMQLLKESLEENQKKDLEKYEQLEKKIKYQIYQNNAKYDHSDVDVEWFSVSDNFFVLFFHAAAFLKLLQKILYHQAPFFTIFLK